MAIIPFEMNWERSTSTKGPRPLSFCDADGVSDELSAELADLRGWAWGGLILQAPRGTPGGSGLSAPSVHDG